MISHMISQLCDLHSRLARKPYEGKWYGRKNIAIMFFPWNDTTYLPYIHYDLRDSCIISELEFNQIRIRTNNWTYNPA